MIKKILLYIILLILFSNICFAGLFEDSKDYIQETSNGEINWSKLKVRAKGNSKEYIANIEKKAADFTPVEAAEVDARLNLFKALKDVPISTSYHIDDVVFLYDDINSKVLNMIKKLNHIEKPSELKDGSVEVLMEIDLKGDILDLIFPKVENLPEATGKPFQGRIRYTSVIFDASKTELSPVLIPYIIDDQEKSYYTLDKKNRANAVKRGLVRYYKSIEDAKCSGATGKMPFLIDYIESNRYKEDTLESPASILEKVRNDAFYSVILRRCSVIIIAK